MFGPRQTAMPNQNNPSGLPNAINSLIGNNGKPGKPGNSQTQPNQYNNSMNPNNNVLNPSFINPSNPLDQFGGSL